MNTEFNLDDSWWLKKYVLMKVGFSLTGDPEELSYLLRKVAEDIDEEVEDQIRQNAYDSLKN